MKPLDELTTQEKAKLLHELFPEEMSALIEFIQETCSMIEREKDIIKLEWENQLLTAEFWFDLSAKVNDIIEQHGNKLGKSSRFFSNQFFNGPVVILIVDCISKYGSAKANHAKFAKAVELLFN